MNKGNIKEELLRVIDYNNLTIANIKCVGYPGYDSEYENSDGDWVIDKAPRLTTIEDLDIDYNIDHWEQMVYGTIYCFNANNEPVWLTRVKECEYAPERWKINQIPDFYKK